MFDTKECMAMLLHAQDYRECDKHIKLLTADSGTITCLLKGVKKPAAKLKAAGMPFACGIYTITGKGNVVTGFLSMHEFDWLTRDYEQYTVASLACEIVSYAEYGSDSGVALQMLLSFLKDLLSMPPNAALKNFLICTLDYVGYKKASNSEKNTKQLIQELEYRLECTLKSAKLVAFCN